MTSAIERIHIVVEGHVQGVGFRYFVERNALELGLTGWVRNLQNGNVEVTAEGDRLSLEKLLSRVISGPSGSHVLNVSTEWSAAENAFDRFSIRSTF